MSNSITEADLGEEKQEDFNSFYMPRKFIFDHLDENGKQNRAASKDSEALRNDLQSTSRMPCVFSFPEPKSYKDSYSKLVKHILNVYNQVRLLVVEQYCEQLKDLTRNFTIEQPVDCINVIHELLTNCCEKLPRGDSGRKNEGSDYVVNQHEELLQKAESKIRILIRNEQIFRLNFDILSQRCEDSDKIIEELNEKLDEYKQSFETLREKNHTLEARLKNRDDELKKINQDFSLLQKSIHDSKAALSTFENLDSLVLPTESSKSINHVINHQVLRVSLKENKSIPSDASIKLSSIIEGKTSKQQSFIGLPPTDKPNKEKKSSSINNILFNTSMGIKSKDKTSPFQKVVTAYKRKHVTNRQSLNASLDMVLNKSMEEYLKDHPTHVTGYRNSHKTNSQNILDISRDRIKVSPQVKERKTVKYGENDGPLPPTNKATYQRLLTNTKQNNARPTSTGRSRTNNLAQKNRWAQTEHSPESAEKLHDSGIFYTYASNHMNDRFNDSYMGGTQKKVVDSKRRDARSTSMKSAEKNARYV